MLKETQVSGIASWVGAQRRAARGPNPGGVAVTAPWRIAIVALLVLAGVGLLLARVPPRKAIPTDVGKEATVLRDPAVAGMFYPSDPSQLSADIKQYLGSGERAELPGRIVAVIVPHAGYQFSGGVAAHAYRQLEGESFETVVLVGPSHRLPFPGAALSSANRWLSPLGPVALDERGREALLASGAGFQVLDAAHREEHSLEVQLPFLQTVLADFKLLPVLVSDSSRENCHRLAAAIAEYARGRSALLVASTDMSHYPAYDQAVRADMETLSAIETLEADRVAEVTQKILARRIPDLGTCLCGEGAVRVVMEAARLLQADRVRVLHYANSGDIAGAPRDRVVGYCAVAICRQQEPEAGLDAEQRHYLLSLARATIEEHVRGGRAPQARTADPDLLRPGAAFVTLRERGALRGCIGCLEAVSPLVETVRDRAIAAATRDPRFRPVKPDELPLLEIEISVLSPLRKVGRADDIDITKHGVVVEQGGKSGIYLPQVAAETGWSRDELLSRLCRDKAGLPADAWRRGADLYVFTVQAFGSPAPTESTSD